MLSCCCHSVPHLQVDSIRAEFEKAKRGWDTERQDLNSALDEKQSTLDDAQAQHQASLAELQKKLDAVTQHAASASASTSSSPPSLSSQSAPPSPLAGKPLEEVQRDLLRVRKDLALARAKVRQQADAHDMQTCELKAAFDAERLAFDNRLEAERERAEGAARDKDAAVADLQQQLRASDGALEDAAAKHDAAVADLHATIRDLESKLEALQRECNELRRASAATATATAGAAPRGPEAEVEVEVETESALTRAAAENTPPPPPPSPPLSLSFASEQVLRHPRRQDSTVQAGRGERGGLAADRASGPLLPAMHTASTHDEGLPEGVRVSEAAVAVLESENAKLRDQVAVLEAQVRRRPALLRAAGCVDDDDDDDDGDGNRSSSGGTAVRGGARGREWLMSPTGASGRSSVVTVGADPSARVRQLQYEIERLLKDREGVVRDFQAQLREMEVRLEVASEARTRLAQQLIALSHTHEAKAAGAAGARNSIGGGGGGGGDGGDTVGSVETVNTSGMGGERRGLELQVAALQAENVALQREISRLKHSDQEQQGQEGEEGEQEQKEGQGAVGGQRQGVEEQRGAAGFVRELGKSQINRYESIKSLAGGGANGVDAVGLQQGQQHRNGHGYAFQERSGSRRPQSQPQPQRQFALQPPPPPPRARSWVSAAGQARYNRLSTQHFAPAHHPQQWQRERGTPDRPRRRSASAAQTTTTTTTTTAMTAAAAHRHGRRRSAAMSTVHEEGDGGDGDGDGTKRTPYVEAVLSRSAHAAKMGASGPYSKLRRGAGNAQGAAVMGGSHTVAEEGVNGYGPGRAGVMGSPLPRHPARIWVRQRNR